MTQHDASLHDAKRKLLTTFVLVLVGSLNIADAGKAANRPHSKDHKSLASHQNSGGVCRRKQFPPRADGRCSFICPRNSCVKDGRACVDEIGDCACKQGFMLDEQRQLCVIDTTECIQTPPKGSPGCHFKCPQHSCIKSGHGCVDGIEDCACVDGYVMDTPTGRCIPSNLNPQNRPLRLSTEPAALGESNTMANTAQQGESQPSAQYTAGDFGALENEVAPSSKGSSQPTRDSGPDVQVRREATEREWLLQPSMVEQDLDSMHRDPQEEVGSTLRELLLLGTQLSIVLAFVRGIVHLYSTYNPVAMERKPYSSFNSPSSMWSPTWDSSAGRAPCKSSPSPMNLHEI